MKKLILVSVSFGFLLSSCFDSNFWSNKKETDNKDNDNPVFCIVKTLDDDIKNCEDGQLLAFLPDSWGNDQLPIMAAAVYCNFDYSIVYNNGGLVCKLDKKKWDKLIKMQNKNQQNN